MGGVVIRKEPDKLVLANPGYIRTGKKQMRLGGESDPRNKALMKMFNLINIGERAGSGVPNIFNVWSDQGWEEPMIEEGFDPDRTVLSLSFKKSGDKKAAIKSGDRKVTKKTQMQYDRILEFMEDGKEYGIWDFCELLGLKESRTKDILKGLSDKIEIIGSNISKKEWVLDGDSVSYGGAIDLRETLEYDISQERNFRFNGLTMDETIHHLAIFISRLWQIHVFGEGNTRTTAVFFIKYLRMLGFKAENDLFAENSWYFRNALVRANYNNIKAGIYETTEFLEKFMRNLVLDEKNELHNRDMHIGAQFLSGHADSINDPINDPIKLIEREEKIVEILRREPALTRSGMAECLGCSDSTVKRALQSMVEKGIIKRIGSNKKGEWIILNVNDNYSDKN